jgi:hypothetical protein
MFKFPDTEKKLRSRVSSYKSSLNKEKKAYGHVSDGSGKRYFLFCLYFVLNDLKKSEEYFEWYKQEFPDDVGEPIQKLCWAISLHRMKREEEARYMLGELMLSNLYLIPHLIGQDVQEYDIWHSSNYEHTDYVEYIPTQVRKSIEEKEIEWMAALYESFDFRRIRKRYIEIYHALRNTKDLEARKALLNDSYTLLDSLRERNS